MTMTSFLLLVDIAVKGSNLKNPLLISFAVIFALSVVVFVLVEIYWAKTPFISPALILEEKVGSYFAVQTMLLVAQFSVIILHKR